VALRSIGDKLSWCFSWSSQQITDGLYRVVRLILAVFLHTSRLSTTVSVRLHVLVTAAPRAVDNRSPPSSSCLPHDNAGRRPAHTPINPIGRPHISCHCVAEADQFPYVFFRMCGHLSAVSRQASSIPLSQSSKHIRCPVVAIRILCLPPHQPQIILAGSVACRQRF